MANPIWRWDDPELHDDDLVYRRVINHPEYFQTQNRFNGAICFHPKALNLSDLDYETPLEDVDLVAEMDPAPVDVEELRQRLGWGKARARRGFRGWQERQAGYPDDRERAGCSVQIQSLMIENGIPTSRLADWGKEVVGRFRVEDVREAGGGIIASEDPSDHVLGKAHGLVRTKTYNMKPPSEWSEMRAKLLDRVAYFESDPGDVVLSTSIAAGFSPVASIMQCVNVFRRLLRMILGLI